VTRNPTQDDYADQHDLILDALAYLYAHAPARRKEIHLALLAIGEWHDHDVETDCCGHSCPAWYPGITCGNCGEESPAAEMLPARDSNIDPRPGARYFIDGAGYFWREFPADEAIGIPLMYSMTPVNPDNNPIPEPRIYLVPEGQR
jgi:hypothetical protein